MNINDVVRLYKISCCLRQCGSTESLMRGAAFSKGAIVLTATHHEAQRLKREYGADARCIGAERLEGIRAPILFDKYTVEEILRTCFDQMDYLSNQVRIRDEKLQKIKELL